MTEDERRRVKQTLERCGQRQFVKRLGVRLAAQREERLKSAFEVQPGSLWATIRANAKRFSERPEHVQRAAVINRETR